MSPTNFWSSQASNLISMAIFGLSKQFWESNRAHLKFYTPRTYLLSEFVRILTFRPRPISYFMLHHRTGHYSIFLRQTNAAICQCGVCDHSCVQLQCYVDCLNLFIWHEAGHSRVEQVAPIIEAFDEASVIASEEEQEVELVQSFQAVNLRKSILKLCKHIQSKLLLKWRLD